MTGGFGGQLQLDQLAPTSTRFVGQQLELSPELALEPNGCPVRQPDMPQAAGGRNGAGKAGNKGHGTPLLTSREITGTRASIGSAADFGLVF